MIQEVMRGCFLLQNVGDGHVEAGDTFEPGDPFIEAINIREGSDFAFSKDGEFLLVNLLLSAGGQPEKLGHQAGADDGGFFALDQGHRLIRIYRQKVFTEKALRQFPVIRQLADLLHHSVNPVDAAGLALILDAVASLGVVHHHLAGAAPSFGVDLEEDDGTAVGDSEPVVVNESDDKFEDSDTLI